MSFDPLQQLLGREVTTEGAVCIRGQGIYHKPGTSGNLGTPSSRPSPDAISPFCLPLIINYRRKHPQPQCYLFFFCFPPVLNNGSKQPESLHRRSTPAMMTCHTHVQTEELLPSPIHHTGDVSKPSAVYPGWPFPSHGHLATWEWPRDVSHQGAVRESPSLPFS